MSASETMGPEVYNTMFNNIIIVHVSEAKMAQLIMSKVSRVIFELLCLMTFYDDREKEYY